MLVGILSDTHDRVDAMAAGMALLRDRGAEMFVHCGDVGGQRVLDLLCGLKSVVVWGNSDFDQAGLSRYAAALGIEGRGLLAEFEVDGKRIAVTHGHDRRLMDRIVGGGQHDYLLHGHTHVARDERVGRVRIVNPGALCRTTKKTVALLDVRGDRVEHLIVAV
ncbi:MAG: YfcE family phosphodiesterase [Tepidisphaeraceae bacterium]|jgi:hypothetical protein